MVLDVPKVAFDVINWKDVNWNDTQDEMIFGLKLQKISEHFREILLTRFKGI